MLVNFDQRKSALYGQLKEFSKRFPVSQPKCDLSFSLVTQILLSKRLLADHLECLEAILDRIDDPISETEYLTPLSATVIAFSSTLAFCLLPKNQRFLQIALGSISGITSALYCSKILLRYSQRSIEKKLEKLLKAIEDFGDCIKRTIVYFNEIHLMNITAKNQIEFRQAERVYACIASIKEVTEILYDSTRKLEENFELPNKFLDFYIPMEELRECAYFRLNTHEYVTKNIKDFYNIYAYVQSQFLLRLAFDIISNNAAEFFSRDIDYVTNVIEKIIQEEEKQFKVLTIDLTRKHIDELTQYHKSQLRRSSGPPIILRESSLKLSACILAVAEECYKLDEVLHRLSEDKSCKQEDTNLIEIATSMRTIENSLSVCCDNFHRLIIMYNKFLGNKLANAEPLDTAAETFSHAIEEQSQNLDSQTQEKIDDFYAYMQEEDDSSDEEIKEQDFPENALLNIEENITKKRFKPVLKQLKNKIDPIRQDMLEKERKVLEAKGVDVDKLFDKEEKEKCEATDDSDSEGSIEEIMKPKIVRPDHYAEMRQFLAEKPAVNLFKIQLPPGNVVPEEVLE